MTVGVVILAIAAVLAVVVTGAVALEVRRMDERDRRHAEWFDADDDDDP